MDKKAIGHHIDWIIAMSIFLIYLMMVFIFFKPGVNPLFESESLLDIVQENFESEVTWEVHKLPLFIEPINYLGEESLYLKEIKWYKKGGDVDDIIYAGDDIHLEFKLCSNLEDGVEVDSVKVDGWGQKIIEKDIISEPINIKGYKNFNVEYVETNKPNKYRIRIVVNLEGEEIEVFESKNHYLYPKEGSGKYTKDQCKGHKEDDINPPENTESLAGEGEKFLILKGNLSKTELTNFDYEMTTQFKYFENYLSKLNDLGKLSGENTEIYFIPRDDVERETPDESKKEEEIGEDDDVQELMKEIEKDEFKDDILEEDGKTVEAIGKDIQDTKQERDKSIGQTATRFYYDSGEDQIGLKVNMPTIDFKLKYLILFSNDTINFDIDESIIELPSETSTACEIRDYDSNDKNIYNPEKNTECQARYILGGEEVINGISLIKFYEMATMEDKNCGDLKGYRCLKKLWGYPDTKEFKIIIYNPSIGNLKESIIAEFPSRKADPRAVVESRQFETYLLGDDGLRMPVIVNILVW